MKPKIKKRQRGVASLVCQGPQRWQLFSPDEVDQTEKEVSEARPLLTQPPLGKEPHLEGAGHRGGAAARLLTGGGGRSGKGNVSVCGLALLEGRRGPKAEGAMPGAEPSRRERVGALEDRMGLLVSGFPSSFFSINNFIFRADTFFFFPLCSIKI